MAAGGMARSSRRNLALSSLVWVCLAALTSMMRAMLMPSKEGAGKSKFGGRWAGSAAMAAELMARAAAKGCRGPEPEPAPEPGPELGWERGGLL